ncbi:hypothetical protein BDN72DRAFT_872367 [Pluteus cervinus]|uniref:Uncharacterized protein n=1 Tax=Pluteus cervinus TaxID=181527 RepID=A0ACD3ACD4_9AGAR|nr:hypothetical protein BDN72DRAFT_872367 [Pluteus cervinus]
MVHRAADSRLLNNLLSHEKDYHKHLLSLLDTSHAALASASAYAAASQPPASTVILAVTSSFAAADEALLRYAGSVDEWRERLKQLKSLEEDIATIMRDREILVTRLIKASKNEKPNRDSILLAQHQPYPSSSTLSLKSDYTGTLNTSTKLAAAQSELQACEAHLAEKERELDALRTSAVRDGLSARCRAMIECGWPPMPSALGPVYPSRLSTSREQPTLIRITSRASHPSP